MPVHVEKRGTKYAVVDDKGKIHHAHATKAKATAQVQAMNIALHKKGKKR